MIAKEKFVLPNYLNQQFQVSQRNKRWSLDDTVIPIGDGKRKLRVLHIVDLATKCCLNTLVTTKDFNSAHIKRAISILMGQLNVQDFDEKDKRLIIHTDRDTHFTSKTWVSLENDFPKKLVLSMSPKGTPIENAVSERFNRTIKELQVPALLTEYGYSNLKEVLLHIDPSNNNAKFYKKLVNTVVNYYNTQHIHSDILIEPALAETIHLVSEPAIDEPEVIASRNNNSSPIEDRVSVTSYKQKVYAHYELAQKLLNEDQLNEHDKFILRKIEQITQNESKKLATLNQAQFISLNEKLEEIDEKLSELNQKARKKRRPHNAIALRDPVAFDVYNALLNYFPSGITPTQIVHYAQMKIICVTLFVTGARVNEIRFLTYEDFKKVLETGNLSLKQTKTNEYRNVYLGDNAANQFLRVTEEIDYLFKTLKFKYLGCSLKNREEAMNNRSWIRKVNSFLREVKASLGLHLQIKSHSFRIGFVNNVLRRSDVSKAAALVGHKSLETTKRYLRYQNNTEEARNFLDEALGLADNENEIQP